MEPTDKAALVVEGGPDDGQSIPLRGPTTSLGRHTGNDVTIADGAVSRSHAEIVDDPKGYKIRDLASTNGTFVNDENIGKQDLLLKDGDRIGLGGAEVSVVFYCQTQITQEISLALTAVHQVVEDQHELAAGISHDDERPAASSFPQEARQLSEDDQLYEGSARLNLKVEEGGMGLVLDFVRQIRDNPDCRILRMVNDPGGGVHIWMGLRQPVSLRRMLTEVDGVINVSSPRGRDLSIDGADGPLTVELSREALASTDSSNGVPCVNCMEPLEPGTTKCPYCFQTQN